jgi:hypothetical protein
MMMSDAGRERKRKVVGFFKAGSGGTAGGVMRVDGIERRAGGITS